MGTNEKRRSVLKRLTTAAAWYGFLRQSSTAEAAPLDKAAIEERMKKAFEEDAAEVERLYSTKPMHVALGPREYVVPANYFGPKEKERPDRFVADNYFGFAMFLPDYGGYTKDNWRDPFDRRLITVLSVKIVDRDRMVVDSSGVWQRTNPADYGEPIAVFEKLRRSLEPQPVFHNYGLEGYRPKNSNVDVVWVGKRSNGEFFFFRSHMGPGDPPQVGIINPLCVVRYYSEKEDLQISYRYSNDHLARWRDIDDAVWAKLHSWQAN
jgi:hypothetical protein